MLSLASKSQDDDRGATAAEYAIMLSLIALVIFGAVQTLGISVADQFEDEQLEQALTAD